MTKTLAFSLILAALLGGAAIGSIATSQADAQADITIMPCSAWADTQYPTIPAYTFTGACINDDGTLSTPKGN